MSNHAVNDEDAALTSFIQLGDLQSLGKLYDKYAASLYGIIIRIVDNDALAEDVLYKVFVNARSHAAASLSTRTSFFNCLFKYSRQLAFYELKQQQLQNLSYQNAVPVGNDTAFDMLYYKGLNYMEAAAALNKSVEEVKAEVRAAIDNLKTKETI